MHGAARCPHDRCCCRRRCRRRLSALGAEREEEEEEQLIMEEKGKKPMVSVAVHSLPLKPNQRERDRRMDRQTDSEEYSTSMDAVPGRLAFRIAKSSGNPPTYLYYQKKMRMLKLDEIELNRVNFLRNCIIS